MNTETTTGPKIVPVLGIYAGDARAKLEKLAKRAAKYGQTITWTETKRIEITTRENWYGKKEKVEVERVDFAIDGEAPRVGDFRFLASIERLEGGVLVSSIGGVEIGEKAYNWDGTCEHCRKPRNRYYGFVVEGPDGERLIVGKGCLRDYTGVDVPASAISLFQYLKDFGSGEEGENWGGGGRWEETIRGVIAVTRAAISIWGWRPSSHEGMTTATYVNLAYRVDRDSKGRDVNAKERAQLKDELKARGEFYAEEAEKIVEWGRNLAARSDYEHNLKVALSGEWVVGKTFNLVVSACAAYDRQVARQDEIKARREAEEAARAARPASDWVGKVGERLSFETVLVERVIGLPDNGFGPSQIYKFVTDDGAVLTWKSGSFPLVGGEPVRANDRVSLVATVKGHGEFREVRETTITRAKMGRITAESKVAA